MSPATDDVLSNPGATLANWRTAPFSRWAFRNIPALLPVAEIAAAPRTPFDLAPAPQSFEGFRLALGGGKGLDLQGFLDATATDALVVLHDGKIALEAYANGNDARTPHILMSATKSVVGMLAGILHARGDLDIEAEVAAYVPEIAATAYAGATVRHLLDMRTGVVLDDGELRRYAAAANWDPVAPGDESSLHAFLAALTAPRRPHGGPFRYISANTDLLGWVIERATGKTFADVASALLWQPLGAADDACITVDRAGAPRCTGGLCATARDLARVGQLVLQTGVRDGAAIVPSTWIEDIAMNGDRDAWSRGEWGQAFAPISRAMSYRSGWYVIHDAPRTVFAMGIHGQNLFVDATNRIVIAKLSSQAERIDYRAMGLTHLAVAEVRRCLTGDA